MTRMERILRAIAYGVGAVTLVLAFLSFVGEMGIQCSQICDPVIVHVYHPIRGMAILAIGALVVTALVLAARRQNPANAKDAPWIAELH